MLVSFCRVGQNNKAPPGGLTGNRMTHSGNVSGQGRKFPILIFEVGLHIPAEARSPSPSEIQRTGFSRDP